MPQKLRLFNPLQHGVREADAWGEGHFGAGRGDRKHKGVDYLATPGERVACPVDGFIRRIGRCYGDTPEYKLVEINTGPAWVRVLYVDPEVMPGDEVFAGDTLGYAQDIAARYSATMSNHVHLEVRLINSVLVGRGRLPSEAVWVDPHLFF